MKIISKVSAATMLLVGAVLFTTAFMMNAQPAHASAVAHEGFVSSQALAFNTSTKITDLEVAMR